MVKEADLNQIEVLKDYEVLDATALGRRLGFKRETVLAYLSNIECAVLNVSGKWDHVVLPSQTEATTILARTSDKESVSMDAGHVGMLVGPAAIDGLWPRLRDWLTPRSGHPEPSRP